MPASPSSRPTRPDLGAVCSVKHCGQEAIACCEHCGQPCCAAHLRNVTIQRRAPRTPPGLGATARPPLLTETYALCPRCGSRAVVPERWHPQ